MEGAGNELLGFLRESRPRSQDCSFRIPSFLLRFRKCYEGVAKNRLWGRAVEKVLWFSAESGSRGSLMAPQKSKLPFSKPGSPRTAAQATDLGAVLAHAAHCSLAACSTRL